MSSKQDKRINAEFSYKDLRLYYSGELSKLTKMFKPKKQRKAGERAQAEQLYILADEEKPTVVWKRLGEETITFSVQEIEETVINTSPQNGGTKLTIELVGRDKLEIYALKHPEGFVDTLKSILEGTAAQPTSSSTKTQPVNSTEAQTNGTEIQPDSTETQSASNTNAQPGSSTEIQPESSTKAANASSTEFEPESSTPTESAGSFITAAEQFVKQQLEAAKMDASHDWDHVLRVKTVAKRLAAEEGLDAETIHVVDLAATLHDVQDYKYSGSEKATSVSVKAFLEKQGASSSLCDRVLSIIASVGFKDELGSAASKPLLLEAAVVQDADRLDAIGALGIARCLTFGGRFNRKLYDPEIPPRDNLTKEQYTKEQEKSTTLNHFHEKLLKLKGMLKTASGKKMGEHRHVFMRIFLDEFYEEWEGKV